MGQRKDIDLAKVNDEQVSEMVDQLLTDEPAQRIWPEQFAAYCTAKSTFTILHGDQ